VPKKACFSPILCSERSIPIMSENNFHSIGLWLFMFLKFWHLKLSLNYKKKKKKKKKKKPNAYLSILDGFSYFEFFCIYLNPKSYVSLWASVVTNVWKLLFLGLQIQEVYDHGAWS